MRYGAGIIFRFSVDCSVFLARLAGHAHRARQGFAGLILYTYVQPNTNSIVKTCCSQTDTDPTWGQKSRFGKFESSPDPAYRNPEKAVALIEPAVALDLEHPMYLTVLALAYFRSGKLEKAVVTQRQALESPKFPLGYREEATAQLREYERALAAQKH